MAALTAAEQQAMQLANNPNTKVDVQQQTGVNAGQLDVKTSGALSGQQGGNINYTYDEAIKAAQEKQEAEKKEAEENRKRAEEEAAAKKKAEEEAARQAEIERLTKEYWEKHAETQAEREAQYAAMREKEQAAAAEKYDTYLKTSLAGQQASSERDRIAAMPIEDQIEIFKNGLDAWGSYEDMSELEKSLYSDEVKNAVLNGTENELIARKKAEESANNLFTGSSSTPDVNNIGANISGTNAGIGTDPLNPFTNKEEDVTNIPTPQLSGENAAAVQEPGGTISGMPYADPEGNDEFYAPGGVGATIETNEKVNELIAEDQKKNKIKKAIDALMEKLSNSDNVILALVGSGYTAIRNIVEANRKNGKADTDGMTAEEMQKYYEAAYDWYINGGGQAEASGWNNYPTYNGGSNVNTTEENPQITGYNAPTTDVVTETVTEETPQKTTATASGDVDTGNMEILVNNYKADAQEAVKAYQEAMKKAQEKYANSYNENIDKATKQARKLSDTEASLAQAKAQTALRNAGQSSNAAAILASQNVVTNFLESFNKNYSEQFNAVENRSIKEFENEVTTAINTLSNNKDILEQEIEYNGKLVTVKSALADLEIKQKQFQIAMEQYQTAKTETEKAEAWNTVQGWATALTTAFTTVTSIFSNETGGDNLPEGIHLVGEKGPELVELPEGAKIYPASVTEEALETKNPREFLIDFNENHSLVNKGEFPADTSILKTVGLLSKYLNNHKTQDLDKLKTSGTKETNYHDAFNKFVTLLDK